MECFKCNAVGVKLVEVISNEGVVKVCEKCAFEEHLPLVNKNSLNSFVSTFPEKKHTVYDRLVSISGVKADNKPEQEQQEFELKKLVDENYSQNIYENPSKRDDLIDNFHWTIMRARRSKHITQFQMAKAILEPEQAIKMAEKGILPQKGCDRFIDKIENYLEIKILKRQPNSNFSSELDLKKDFAENPSFDPVVLRKLTISDLKKLKTKQEEEILEKKEQEKSTNKEPIKEIKEKRESAEDDDISQEKINKIIFGK